VNEFDPTNVKTYSYSVPFSFEALIEAGFITEEQARAKGWQPTVHPPIPIRRRALSRIRNWWYLRPRIHMGPCSHEDCQ
jgi:hypothetical protein